MTVVQETSPIIVYGAPRSGTTYLTGILNEHPEIFISQESRVFVWAHKSLNDLTNDESNVFFSKHQFVSHLRAEYPELIRGFYRALYPQARYWGDKAPHYVFRHNLGCLDTIADLFQGARFIHIIRDGRDVVSSFIRMRRPSGEPWGRFDGAPRLWTTALDIGCGFGRRQSPGQYFEVRYEDLIQDDVGVVREMFNWLGIEMHPNVVEFCQRQRQERTPFSGPTRDLSRGATASDWGRLLTPDQQLRSLEMLGRHLIQFGYETETSLIESYQVVAERRAREMVKPVGEAVRSALPEDATVLVVDPTGRSLTSLDGRSIWPFPQTGDRAWASPYLADGAEAIAQLESLRANGADFLLIPSTAFWWLELYTDFKEYLDSRYPVVMRQEDACVIYALDEPIGPTPTHVLDREHAASEWMDRLHIATQEIAAVIPSGETFILVDDEQLGMDANVAGRRRLPFLEGGGRYWGPPPDDPTAIQELERLRREGATFVAFAWSSFWWLTYFPGLHRHLRSAYPCVLENDRLVVFDLRRRLGTTPVSGNDHGVVQSTTGRIADSVSR